MRERSCSGQAGYESRFHVLHRTPEHHENEHAPLYQTDKRLFKIENHMRAIALHYMYYNFCRIHKTLRRTPAMEAGVTKKLWSIEDVVALLPASL
jgi:hypothetical protein